MAEKKTAPAGAVFSFARCRYFSEAIHARYRIGVEAVGQVRAEIELEALEGPAAADADVVLGAAAAGEQGREHGLLRVRRRALERDRVARVMPEAGAQTERCGHAGEGVFRAEMGFGAVFEIQ